MVSLLLEHLAKVFLASIPCRFVYTTIGDSTRQEIFETARVIISFPFEEVVRTRVSY